MPSIWMDVNIEIIKQRTTESIILEKLKKIWSFSTKKYMAKKIKNYEDLRDIKKVG